MKEELFAFDEHLFRIGDTYERKSLGKRKAKEDQEEMSKERFQEQVEETGYLRKRRRIQ